MVVGVQSHMELHPFRDERAHPAGLEILEGVRVTGLRQRSGRISSVSTDRGEVATDHLVLAAGASTPELAATLGVAVPIETPPGLIVHSRPVPKLLNGLVIATELHVRQTREGRIIAGSDFGGTDPGTDPGTTDPSDPGTTDPGTTDPGTDNPDTTDPAPEEPAPEEPSLPTGAPTRGMTGFTVSIPERTVSYDVPFAGATDATVRTTFDGVTQDVALGDGGTGMLSLRPTWEQFCADAVLTYSYVEGDLVGEVVTARLSDLNPTTAPPGQCKA